MGILPLSQGGQNLQMSQMLSLLDMAVASCAAADQADLISDVMSLWRAAHKDWRAINDTWAESAAMLAGAVAANGRERAQLSADPTFADSYCARWIASSDSAAISV